MENTITNLSQFIENEAYYYSNSIKHYTFIFWWDKYPFESNSLLSCISVVFIYL